MSNKHLNCRSLQSRMIPDGGQAEMSQQSKEVYSSSFSSGGQHDSEQDTPLFRVPSPLMLRRPKVMEYNTY